jgi:hypothetical protein
MKENYKRLIEQIAKSAEEGIFGEAALLSSKDYEGVPLDTSRLTKFIYELSVEMSSNNSEINSAAHNFWLLLVAVYNDCKKKDVEIANAFANSFIKDYPDMPNTALSLRWNSLAQSAFAFKSVAFSGDPLLVWQQTSRLFLDYSEFMDGLLGYLIISLRCALEKKINPNILKSFYAVKAKHFEELTNGENGVFYLFHRIIRPKLRNGIAHGNAWLDRGKNKVRYTDGRTDSEYEIDISEFGVLALLGSHLAKSYMAALATIVIWEDGTEEQKLSLPPDFVDLLSR